MIQSAVNVLTPYLDPGEVLLWSGKPHSGIRLRIQDFYLIPFSLFWGGFAIFWEFMAITQLTTTPGPPAIVFPLFGVPFVAIGLYLIFGRFFVDARSRANTFYGVTGDRIIISSGLFSQQTKSIQLSTLPDVSLTQHQDGRGTITFNSATSMNRHLPAGSWPGAGRYAPPSFEFIEDAKEVYGIIRNAQKTLSSSH